MGGAMRLYSSISSVPFVSELSLKWSREEQEPSLTIIFFIYFGIQTETLVELMMELSR